jgi:hypothetical protein
MKYALFFISVVSLLGMHAQSMACSAFFARSAMGQFVGKNFDWYVGDGLLSVNPQGAKREPLFSSTQGPRSWKARYGSLSFSPIGPGLPISGMNEAGLVVEGLQHTDFDERQIPTAGLTTLEWAQYLLDNFDSIDQVRAFAERTGFFQLALPIHLLVCDARGACLVAEGQAGDMTIVSDAALETKVLANHSWRRDFEASKRSKKSLSWLSSIASWFSKAPHTAASAPRFATLSRRAQRGVFHREKEIFSVLDKARIQSLTKWQIIWHQDSRSVTWRHFDQNTPSPPLHIEFEALDFRCSNTGVRVADTAPQGGVAFAGCDDDCLVSTEARISRILALLGEGDAAPFKEKLLRFVTRKRCADSVSSSHPR